MKSIRTIAVVAAVLVLATGAAAAMPGHAQADDHAENATQAPAGDHHVDEQAGNDAADSSPATSGNETAHGHAADQAESGHAAADHGARGPPIDLPAQVPDFVSEIHHMIRQFLDGSLGGSLGDAVSGVAGNATGGAHGGASAGTSGHAGTPTSNGAGNATATPGPSDAGNA
ncbi:MAG: hypothetical protein ABEJ89_02020 [Haloarculaceae archaeon]